MQRPNVVFITVDSLRHDALSCLGGAPNASPCIDELARNGALFTQAISNGPRTPSAFPPIMCSLYPLVSGERGLPTSAPTWAEQMRQAGYRTAAFNLDNPFLSARCGYDRGFDLFLDFWTKPELAKNERSRQRVWHRFKRLVQSRIGRYSLALLLFIQAIFRRGRPPFEAGETITKRAIAWMREEQDPARPFFAWLHYMDVHYPYLLETKRPSGRRLCRYLLALGSAMVGAMGYPVRVMRSLYAAKVSFVDKLIGDVMADLKDAGVMGRTVVVVTSDHGDRFNEHGGFTHGPLLYDELLRVPLVISGPGVGGGRVVGEQVALIDLCPAVLDLVGLAAPPTFQGRSFAGLVSDDRTPYEAAPGVFAEATHRGGRRSRVPGGTLYRIVCCRTPRWKYILDEEGAKRELYDLRTDPGERINVAESMPDIVRELDIALQRHLAEVASEGRRYKNDCPHGEGHDDDAVVTRLTALGYL